MNIQNIQTLTKILSIPRRLSSHPALFRNYSENSEKVASVEVPPSFANVEEEFTVEEKAKKRLALCNKSRLQPQHRKLLQEELPYEEPTAWHHYTEKYQRKMIGRYGLQGSKVNPRICFPTDEDNKKLEEYERVAYPFTLQEMMKNIQLEKEAQQAAIKKREDEISKKLEKLEQWKSELNAKIAKKEADAIAAREKKERLVEEVRRHFGFKIDPKDERFKELLEQKEKEDRKKQKEAKRKAKEEKMMAKLMTKTAQEKSVAAEETPQQQ